jgi:DNA polymerase alpha subunit A
MRNENVMLYHDEKSLLDAFISRLHLVDPDLMIAHNLCNGILDLLLTRIHILRINHWSRLGRFKR